MEEKKMAVLVVDDESNIREFLEEMIPLLFPEIEVVVAESVARARAKMALNLIPDIIMTDLNMPIETGWDLIKYVRESKSQKIKDIPVLIMTGNMAPNMERHQQAQAGLDISRTFILKKPFDRRLLERRLEEILADMRREEKITAALN